MLRHRIRSFLNHESEHFEHKGWHVHLFSADIDSGNKLKGSLEEMWQHMNNPAKIFKSDHCSFVAAFEYENEMYVIKKFTLQSTWFWFRWTSTVFASLGEVTCSNSLLMKKDGLLIPEPIMLWQRVRNLMVIESWMVYKYLEGEILNSSNVNYIVAFVKSMHSRGWIHRDPHPANFIKTVEGVATLDALRIVKSNSIYLKACDVLHMTRDMPEAARIYGTDELGFWLTTARHAHNFIRVYRFVKHQIQALIGYNPQKAVLVSVSNNNSLKRESMKKND